MPKIPTSSLIQILERISISVQSGIDVRTIWERESNQCSTALRPSYLRISQHVAAGKPMAQGMVESGVFPTLVTAMAKVGEETGTLDLVFKELADHYKTMLEFRKTFLTAITWPMLELGGAILIFGLLIVALGIVASITGTKPLDVFGLGFGTAGNLTIYLLFIGTFFGSLTFALIGLAKGWFGEAPTRLAYRIPLLGSTIQYLALSRMAWSLAIAHGAGMNVFDTMSMSLKSTESKYYTDHETAILQDLRDGKEINHAIAKTDVFRQDFLDTLSTGELTGQISETMHRLAEDYRERARSNLKKLAVIGGAMVMMMVMCSVGFLIIYMFKKLYIDQIQGVIDSM